MEALIEVDVDIFLAPLCRKLRFLRLLYNSLDKLKISGQYLGLVILTVRPVNTEIPVQFSKQSS